MRSVECTASGKTGEGDNIICKITQPSDDHIGIHIYTVYDDRPIFSIVLGDDADDAGMVEDYTIDDLVDVLVGMIHGVQSRRTSIMATGDYVAFSKLEPDDGCHPSKWYYFNRYWMYNAICHMLRHSEK